MSPNTAFTTENKEKEIARILYHIPEDFLTEAYQKVVSESGKILSAKVKNKTSFYITIFYKGKLIKSRTISTVQNDNGKTIEEKEEEHKKFFTDFSSQTKSPEYFEKDTICALKFGEVVFIVQNHNIEASRIFVFVLAYALNSFKSILRNKEPGSLKDLIRIITNQINNVFLGKNINGFGFILKYLKDASKHHVI